MAEKHGVAMIGLGMAALPHAKALQALAPKIDVKAVYSRSAAKRAAFTQTFAFPTAVDEEAILKDPQIQSVLLLTPPNARLEWVQKLAAAGKNILMEKPIERTLEQSQRIVDHCRNSGIVLGLVLQHRFRESARAARKLLSEGRIGDLVAVDLRVPWWRPQTYYDEPGRGTYERDGGGVLISQAIHSLDLMLNLAGPVSTVQAMTARSKFHNLEAEDFVTAGLTFQNGALGSVTATTAFYPGHVETITLYGSKGTASMTGNELALTDNQGKVTMFGKPASSGGGADPMDFPFDWHMALIEDFVDAVDAKRVPAVPGEEALHVHRLIKAMILSGREKREISLDKNEGFS